MIEYVLLLWLLKQCEHDDAQPAQEYSLDRSLEIGAGLDFNPPDPQRPELHIVR